MRLKSERLKYVMPVFAAFALAACGSGADDAEADGLAGVSNDAELGQSGADITIVPGEYRAQFELLDFAVPGLDDAQAQMMHNAFLEGIGEGATFCVTPEEAEQGPEVMLQKIAESECVFSSLDGVGNAISAEMQCISEDGLEGTFNMQGEVTGESWSLVMDVDQRIPGVAGDGRVQMKMQNNSMRVGDCG